MKLSKEFIEKFRKEAKKAQWEINRWNGKSIDDLVVDYLEDHEFNQDDFENMVCLTIEEAKQVKVFLDDAIELHDKGVVVIQSSGFDTVQLIKERIKKVEVQNEIK
jgi:hypothetical protein